VARRSRKKQPLKKAKKKRFYKLENTAMKNFVILLAATAATLLTAFASAEARPVALYERWCLNVIEGRGGDVFRCDYATYNQCMASRAANGEWCMLNPALGSEGTPRYYR
jgi:hypothetical protein